MVEVAYTNPWELLDDGLSSRDTLPPQLYVALIGIHESEDAP
jgi:hypothetical protein